MAGTTRRWFLAAAAIAAGFIGHAAHAAEVPVVAAAASLRFVLQDIAADFERATGNSVRLTFGATGTLVAQIENGAPYELLLAADEVSPAKLAAGGLTQEAPQVFARGALALVAPKGSAIALDGALKGLGEAVAQGKIKRVAIANPEVAPYGAAAKAALIKAGLWDKLADRIVTGENVGQATQFVSSGAVEAGLVAASLAKAPELAAKLEAVTVDEGMYTPVNHALAVTETARPVAVEFARYCLGPEAKGVFLRHGFLPPG